MRRGPASLTEFRQQLGIARNILADRLRRLVEDGILRTSATPSGKHHVYELTRAGQDLFTTIVALRQWGERHAFAEDEPRSTLVDRDGRQRPTIRGCRPRVRGGGRRGRELPR
ncbi:winged helix-turn-helix transcriptional regulator [Nocardia salmonicida]|uniref:winged helix-turn-helix transcriptional regulator n=1 Tax=Nocardia salmonicida TaxID=53431 RepID=UPI0033D49A65